MEAAKATGIPVEHVHIMSKRREIHGKRKKMAQKEDGQAQTPQTAQKDTLAAASEGLVGIAT
jgi:hypothetical protein